MTTITMHPVKSSQILSVGYDPIAKIFYIEFHNWNVYEYYEVPAEVASVFRSPSTSIGTYFHREFKGLYEYKKLDEKVNNGMLKLK